MSTELTKDALSERIRSIPDYPRPGIIFRDITTLLQDSEGFSSTINRLVKLFEGQDFDCVAGIEARGFILGSAVAYALGKGFIPIRKKGKLPYKVLQQDYALEYGLDTLELHTDALKDGQRVLLVDDLIATGGSAEAAVTLIRRSGAECIAAAFVIELLGLSGVQRLQQMNVNSVSLLQFS